MGKSAFDAYFTHGFLATSICASPDGCACCGILILVNILLMFLTLAGFLGIVPEAICALSFMSSSCSSSAFWLISCLDIFLSSSMCMSRLSCFWCSSCLFAFFSSLLLLALLFLLGGFR